MILMEGQEFLSAEEVCALLGIKPATLYTYVSRGVLKSYRQGIRRKRLYRRDEVERLTRLRGPDGDLESALDSGETSEADQPDGAWIPYA
jgi:excisionase family DNA binding protein